jgi:hypothetical protein
MWCVHEWKYIEERIHMRLFYSRCQYKLYGFWSDKVSDVGHAQILALSVESDPVSEVSGDKMTAFGTPHKVEIT